MRSLLPGLHFREHLGDAPLEGFSWVRIDQASYRWHAHKPLVVLRFVVLEPHCHATRTFSGRLYCTQRALWKLNWFLRDFGYDPELLAQDRIDERALLNLQGVLRTSLITFHGRSYQNLDAFTPATAWEEVSPSRNSYDLQSHAD